MSGLDLVAALRGTHASGSRLCAPGADLRGADLSSADLYDADLTGANLTGADLTGADLHIADLTGANLHNANLSGADLHIADLTGANLSGAGLYGADLTGADLTDANLTDANLHNANLHNACTGGGILCIGGIPSGAAVLVATPQGWQLTIGCWSGSVTDLRTLIASDTGWPEARGDEVLRRRPILEAVADLCDAHIAAHADVLSQLIAAWSGDKS